MHCPSIMAISLMWLFKITLSGSSGGSAVKNPPAMQEMQETLGSFPGWGRSPRGGNGNPLQYSCWENPMDRGTWWATVHGVTESDVTTYLTHVDPISGVQIQGVPVPRGHGECAAPQDAPLTLLLSSRPRYQV